jgi:hypothetical protein
MMQDDQPIRRSTEDLLGRSDFADNLAQAVLGFNRMSSFTIGLYGVWGSGKTSVLNMVEEKIIERTEENSKKPLVVHFNPWLFTEYSQLVSQFFKQISNGIKEDGKAKNAQEAAAALEEYSALFELAVPVVSLSAFGKALAIIGKGLGSRIKKQQELEQSDLYHQKEKLVQALKKYNRKIIVIMDDIDRLSNQEIVLIFRLVKSIADLPGIIYLLAFDRDIVVRALNDVQYKDEQGEEYLEKIIQVPFEVPQLEQVKVHKLFLDKLNILVGDIPDKNFDAGKWSELFHGGICPFLTSIRAVNRLMNTLTLKYQIQNQDIDIIDLIAITTLQVFEPKVYRKIGENPETFCGAHGYGDYADMKRKQEQEVYESVIKEADASVCSAVKEILVGIFPKAAYYENKNYYIPYNSQKSLLFGQICNPNCFARYFTFSLNEHLSSVNVASQLEDSRENLQRAILDYNRQSKLDEWFEIVTAVYANDEELHYLIHAKKICNILLHNWKILRNPSEENFFSTPLTWYFSNLLGKMLDSYNDEERFLFLKNIFEWEDVELMPLISCLFDLEREHGRFTDKEKASETSISLEALTSLEEIVYKKINRLVEQKLFFEDASFFYAYEFMKKLYAEELKKIFSDAGKEPRELAIAVSAFAGKGKGAGRTVYDILHYDLDALAEYFDVEEVGKSVGAFVHTAEFSTLRKETQEKIAVFLIRYQKRNTTDGDTIFPKEVEEFLKTAL